MSSCTWERALFLPEIHLTHDWNLQFTVDGVDTGSPVLIPAGAWFANCLTFWAWVIDQTGADPEFLIEYSSNNIVWLTPQASGVWDVNLSGNRAYEITVGASTWGSVGYLEAPAFHPSYPLTTFDVGSYIHGGTSVRAMTGKAYSVAGIEQPVRAIQVQCDYGSLNELNVWRSFWDSYFARGASASFWHGSLPDGILDSSYLSASTCAMVDQLVTEPSIRTWSGQRTVEYRNVSVTDSSAIEYRRRPNVPLSEPDIQMFYIPLVRFV
jgi:hypothetical protein